MLKAYSEHSTESLSTIQRISLILQEPSVPLSACTFHCISETVKLSQIENITVSLAVWWNACSNISLAKWAKNEKGNVINYFIYTAVLRQKNSVKFSSHLNFWTTKFSDISQLKSLSHSLDKWKHMEIRTFWRDSWDSSKFSIKIVVTNGYMVFKSPWTFLKKTWRTSAHFVGIDNFSGGSRIFLRGVRQLQKGLLFCKCFTENYMKMKEFGPGGRLPARPPWICQCLFLDFWWHLPWGFKAKVDSLACILHGLHSMDSSDSSLVWHLLTSWRPTCSWAEAPGL